ncbi:MAG: hypothetical protein IKK21_09330 [Clostridia bacterium]|nr:hypothetical protein [Clostridia bacterium]
MMKRLMAMMLALAMLAMLPAAAEESLLPLPRIPAAEEAALNEAANAPGGTLRFTNPEDAAVWPMIPAEEDGFACLTSTNWGVDSSVSSVQVRVEAKAGDALSFAVKTSMETGYDLFQLCVDGEVVKVFSGEGDWRSYAYAFPADGVYDVAFRYSKDTVSSAGSDAAYIRDVQLLTGDAAVQALAANPAYPEGAERALTIANPAAREIVFEDPSFALTGLYGLARYYIVPEAALELRVTLDAADDPDGAILTVNGGESRTYPVVSGAAEGDYCFTLPLEGRTQVQLTPSRDCMPLDWRTAICFPDEAAVDGFLQILQGNGYQVTGWRDADQAACRVTVIDQQGEFIPGVTVSVLMQTGVTLHTSDEEGEIAFALNGTACTLHIVDAPEGFTFDPDRAWTMDAENSEIIIDLTRAEE